MSGATEVSDGIRSTTAEGWKQWCIQAEIERTEVRGAIHAQDNRERAAGEKCGVSYDLSGCDWPDAVTDTVLSLCSELAEWKSLMAWGGTPEIVQDFIAGQQNRIRCCEGIEKLLEDAYRRDPSLDPALVSDIASAVPRVDNRPDPEHKGHCQ